MYLAKKMEKIVENINIKSVRDNPKQPLMATEGAAGYDIHAYLPGGSVPLKPNSMYTIPTGWSLEIPRGYFGMIAPRSGLGKKGIILANTVGIIDSDYRGEISVILKNMSQSTFILEDGMRIAQLMLMQHASPKLIVVNELEETVRGDGGFGSTGLQEVV